MGINISPCEIPPMVLIPYSSFINLFDNLHTMERLKIVLICLISLTFVTVSMGCTTFVVTDEASDDGSVFVGHSNDGFGSGLVYNRIREDMVTFRHVPAKDHPDGATRKVVYDPNSGGEFVGEKPESETETDVIGGIPEVSHTYAYITGSYGIINEHQLMSGECTDYAKIHPGAEKGKRIFYSSELSNIALERCKTAKEAVRLIGSLIDTYGYYGTGETLIFADPKDAWVIEMCGGTPDGTGGYWAAEQITQGHVFVAANEFRIRELDPNNSSQIFGKNLKKDAEKMGWYNQSGGNLDWCKTFGIGEYSHPYYSQSRVWRIFDRLAPSLHLSPYVEGPFSKEYPFSVKPDTPVNITNSFSLYRDHYEGTVFDLTTGPAAGPFGDPYRVWGPFDLHDAPYEGELKPGSWARPISTDPCGYSYVCQGRADLPDIIGGICWLGLSSPSETCYVPFYAGIYMMPTPYLHGSHWSFDLNTAFWPFELLQNWARFMYDHISPEIKAEQMRLEGEMIARQPKIEARAVDLYNTNVSAARLYLTEYSDKTAQETLNSWINLTGKIIVTYRNGNYNDVQNKSISNIGYPDWWYDLANYQYGPRVYDLEGLRSIPNVSYTGKIANITGDPITYIRQNQV
ncbi:MAG: peptidase U34 [Methanomicrobiales archaeon HGW-Methanomicrobiales-4]|nr:MAG: peptidase U34 [Methanomicrobiales archaeon HGW-Methanomicrobiales-4]